jgi:CubicO group peptidase (beta-lactamase class C family)
MSDLAAKVSAAPVAARLDELFKPWNSSNAPGLVVAISHRGEVVYRRGFGLASIEHAVANTPATRMRIGSTTKHFAAFAAMLLVEEGLLDLQAPIRRYLPELKNPAGAPTLLQLMHHCSGVRDPFLPELLRHQGILPVLPAGHSLKATQGFRDGSFPPGERMVYSNNGYHLLSLAIERVSGRSLGEVLTERVLCPLGMHDTALLPSDMQIVPRLATFHVPAPGSGFRRGIYPTEELLGAGGMISTVDDMLAWMAHLRSPQKIVGSTATWARMLERPRYNSGALGDYCLGLLRFPYRGVETVQHSGATLGSGCQMLTVAEKALDIIIMSNRSDVPTMPLANKVIDLILEGDGLEPPKRAVAAQDHEALPGRWYSSRSRTVLELVRYRPEPEKPEVLAVKMHNELCGLLFEAGEVLRKPGFSMETLEIPRNQAALIAAGELECTLDGNPECFTRVNGEPPSAGQLAAYAAGRYRYLEFGIEMELVLKDGQLRLEVISPYWGSHLELKPLSELALGYAAQGSATAVQQGSGTIVLERRGDGSVSGLWLSSVRERNVWFERC